MWHAWQAVADGDVAAMIQLDEELTALRPSLSARRSSRAMGQRLLTTWQALHPDVRLERLALVREGRRHRSGSAAGIRRGVRVGGRGAPRVGRGVCVHTAGGDRVGGDATDADRSDGRASIVVAHARARAGVWSSGWPRADDEPRVVHAGDGHRGDDAAVSAIRGCFDREQARSVSELAGRSVRARPRSWTRSARRCASATGSVSSPTTSSRARTWSSSCAARR